MSITQYVVCLIVTKKLYSDAATEKPGNFIQPPKRPKRKAWDLKGKLQDAQADCVFYKSAIAAQQQELEKYSVSLNFK